MKLNQRLLISASLLIIVGCTSTTNSPTFDTAATTTAADSTVATAESAAATDTPATQLSDKNRIVDFNRRLLAAAGQQQAGELADLENYEYQLGSGDVLEIAVFQVDELNTKARVSGRGTIIVPLLGELDVGGKTASEVERLLVAKLGADYLHDPQVTVFVADYRSQEVAVSGAVASPAVFSIRQPRNVLELLAMAGGVTESAASRINVQTTALDPDSGQALKHSLIIDLHDVVDNSELQKLVLHGGDSIHVPDAGVVFVEGAVEKPGVYPIRGRVNVLKAIAMAGGTRFDAVDGGTQVFRNVAGEQQVVELNLGAVRSNEAPAIELEDGDVVMVQSSSLKRGFGDFWKGFSSIISLRPL